MLSNTLVEAVKNKDVRSVKNSFYTIILSDPFFDTGRFDEAIEYVKNSNLSGFIDEHDGEKLIDKSEWTETYFDLLASRLVDNFSEERIEQIKMVAEKLKKDKERKEKKKTTASSDESKKIINSKINVKTKEDYSWILPIGVLLFMIVVIKKIIKGGK